MGDADIEKKGMGKLGKGCLIILGVFVVLVILGAIAGGGEEVNISPEASENPPKVEQAEETSAPENNLTGPQRKAVRSAESYLDFSGFSRKGLIEQLSSDAGDGYDKADAAAAVDSLDVDWNEQAARSAKNYLDMMGFSCNGLIEQLSSDSGDGYTASEARYGAEQAGAC